MKLLDEQQAVTLRAAVNRIIPADDEYPGGADAGAFDFLLRHLGPGGYFPSRLPEYRMGLDTLDALARRMYSGPFADLDAAAQDAALIQFASESSHFFRMLVEQTQEGFYTSPVGFKMVGWEVTG